MEMLLPDLNWKTYWIFASRALTRKSIETRPPRTKTVIRGHPVYVVNRQKFKLRPFISLTDSVAGPRLSF